MSDTTLASLSADHSARHPAARSLNRLERAGWAVVAAQTFALAKGEAAALRELVLAPGRVVTNDRLRECFEPQENKRQARPVSLAMATRMARVRNAIEDLGLPRSAIRNEPEVGYVVDAWNARRIRQIVEDR